MTIKEQLHNKGNLGQYFQAKRGLLCLLSFKYFSFKAAPYRLGCFKTIVGIIALLSHVMRFDQLQARKNI